MRDLPDDFQLEQLRAIIAYLPKDKKIFAIDVGAHRGIWTKEMLKTFGVVTAIEPSDLYKLIDKRANVINAAVGSKIGRCSLAEGKKNTGQKHVVAGKDIKMITLDSLNLTPDFIKIDVEGMEYDVLVGAKETIERYKPYILIEEANLSERYGCDPEKARRLLKRLGMKLLVTFHMLPEKDINTLWGW